MKSSDEKRETWQSDLLLPLCVGMLLLLAGLSQLTWEYKWVAMVIVLIVGGIAGFLLLAHTTAAQYAGLSEEELEEAATWEAWREASLRTGYTGGIIDIPYVLSARDEHTSGASSSARRQETQPSEYSLTGGAAAPEAQAAIGNGSGAH